MSKVYKIGDEITFKFQNGSTKYTGIIKNKYVFGNIWYDVYINNGVALINHSHIIEKTYIEEDE